MKRLLILALVPVGVLLAALALRTMLFSSRQVRVESVPVIGSPQAAQRLAGAVRIPTITYEDSVDGSRDAFLTLHAYLEQEYPRVHHALSREVVGGYSLLYTWAGSDPTLAPIILTGHLDVVPVDPGTCEEWIHPPFSGHNDGTYIWGRGSMDDRFTVIGVLEAVDRLLSAGYRPRRTIYIAFGHDEERGGVQGAAQIAALLKQRGVRPAFVLDEGLFIAEGIVPGLQAPVALIGVGEKGSVSLELSVTVEGGHSSTPPKDTAIGILSQALTRLESNPMPPRMSDPVRQLFAFLGPEMGWLQRLAIANLWLFEPLVRQQLAAKPVTNTLIRTTAAPTILQAGIKENLLPSQANAVINFRIVPGDSVAGVVSYVTERIGDPRVQVRPRSNFSEPSAISDASGPAFQALQRAIRQVFPGTLVAPSLMVARTDARHYTELTDNVYRFVPIHAKQEDVARFHGVNERVSIENLAQGIQFYYQLIKNADDL